MERIFGKSFYYAVDRYEIWHNQECIQQDKIEADIFAVRYGDELLFGFTGLEELGYIMPFSININNPTSQILNPSSDGIVNSSRIQYYKEDWSGNKVPYICHLFCQYGRIDYVRFAYPAENSYQMFPIADTIHEFYGDMILLGGFDEAAKQKLDGVCRIMITNATSNKFHISLEESVNAGVAWRDMSENFKKELIMLTKHPQSSQITWEQMVSICAIKQIIEYNNTLGYVPKTIVDHICNDMFSAAKKLHYGYEVDCVEQLKFKVFYDLTSGNF